LFDITTHLFKQQKVADASLACKDAKRKQEEVDSLKYEYSASDTRVMRVLRLISDPYTELTCLFLQASMPLFDDVNRVLQLEEPLIHLIHDCLTQQLRRILIRFVKPSAFASNICPTQVQYKDENNHKNDTDITVGSAVRDFIIIHETELSNHIDQFYGEVKQFFMRSCDYMINKFPFGDEVLLNAKVIDISKRHEVSFNQIKFFTDRFKCFLTCTLDNLEEEFIDYQTAALSDAITLAKRVDVAWHMISQIKDPATGNDKYGKISAVMKGILVMFHSNADCERLFSMVTKNKTEYRSNLSSATLGNLITRKTMMSATCKVCHTSDHSQELLKKAKTATYKHLQAAASTATTQSN
jgi:hypothetical protein